MVRCNIQAQFNIPVGERSAWIFHDLKKQNCNKLCNSLHNRLKC